MDNKKQTEATPKETERKWKSRVGCHLIMKNEELDLDRALSSMKGCWDTLCIVDTGSTDKSIEIAKSHGAFVKEDSWYDDFGRSRNTSLDFLYETDPNLDWVMWFDCDDVLMSPQDVTRYREILDQYLDNPNVECINMPYIYSHSSNEIGNQSLPEFKYYRLRAFKKGTARWTARIHEYLESNAGKHIAPADVTFHHFRRGTGVANTARNLRILRKVYDDAKPEEKARYAFYLGKECTYNGLHEEAIEHFKFYLPISNFPAEKIRALYELANCYKVLGKIEDAKRWAFEAIIADQRYPDPYVLMSQIAYEQKDWKMCINWAQIAPNLDRAETYFFDYMPMSTWLPQDYMQAAYYYLGQPEKAKEALDKCLFYKPHERRYLHNWALFHNDIKKTAIIIPTLDRKERLINCVSKIKENIMISNYEILIGVDGNEAYFNELNECFKAETQMSIVLFEKKVGVPTIVEELIDLAKEHGCTYCTYLGDDTEPLVGFLVHAYLACEDKNLVCYNDKVWNGEIACHWFAPIDLRDKLGGFFFHKGYHHLGCDNELTEKAKAKGLYKYEPKAYVDHIHCIVNVCSDKNKVAEVDDCYKLAWNDANCTADRELLARRKANNWLADTEEIKIDIGAGTVKHEGYITLDKFCKADIKADILEEGLFKPETIDKFLLEHVLEHFTEAEGKELLSILYKALKLGGEIEIAVPDMGLVQLVENPEYRCRVMYGWQCNPGHFHKFGYLNQTLKKTLEAAGFTTMSLNETFEYDAPSLRAVAVK